MMSKTNKNPCPSSQRKILPKCIIFHGWELGQGSLQKNKHKPKIISGYVYLFNPDHPTGSNYYVKRCRLIVEKAIGHCLGSKIPVHHVNEKRLDDRNSNLVVCENLAYHFLLHLRKKALDACGNPHYRKCTYCKEYDDPKKLFFARRSNSRSPNVFHRECHNFYVNQNNPVKSILFPVDWHWMNCIFPEAKDIQSFNQGWVWTSK